MSIFWAFMRFFEIMFLCGWLMFAASFLMLTVAAIRRLPMVTADYCSRRKIFEYMALARAMVAPATRAS